MELSAVPEMGALSDRRNTYTARVAGRGPLVKERYLSGNPPPNLPFEACPSLLCVF